MSGQWRGGDIPTAITRTAGLVKRQKYNVLDFGAAMDAVVLSDGVTNGTTTFTSASATFTSSDVGKVIGIAGAGAAGAVLSTTIAGFTDAHTITLTVAATGSATGLSFVYGTDDSPALLSAITAAGAGEVYFPPGSFTFAGTLTAQAASIWRSGGFNGVLYWVGDPNSYPIVVGGTGWSFHDMQLQGVRAAPGSRGGKGIHFGGSAYGSTLVNVNVEYQQTAYTFDGGTGDNNLYNCKAYYCDTGYLCNSAENYSHGGTVAYCTTGVGQTVANAGGHQFFGVTFSGNASALQNFGGTLTYSQIHVDLEVKNGGPFAFPGCWFETAQTADVRLGDGASAGPGSVAFDGSFFSAPGASFAALSQPGATPGAAGTIPDGTYYFRYTWTGAGPESSANAFEGTFTLANGSSIGSVALALPSIPAGYTGANVYVGTVSGTYTHQVSVVSSAPTITALGSSGSYSPVVPVNLDLRNGATSTAVRNCRFHTPSSQTAIKIGSTHTGVVVEGNTDDIASQAITITDASNTLVKIDSSLVANPMTTLGDLIAGGASGAVSRLGVAGPSAVAPTQGLGYEAGNGVLWRSVPVIHGSLHGPYASDPTYLDRGNQSPSRIENMDRSQISPNAVTGLTSGVLYLVFVTAGPAPAVTKFQMRTSSTVAAYGASPACYLGLYSVPVDANGAINGNPSLVAKTADLHTTFASTPSALQSAAITLDGGGGTIASYTPARGTRYALGFLFVNATTMPTFVGAAGNADLYSMVPIMTGTYGSSLTSLPSPLTFGSIGTTGFNSYICIVP